MELPSSFGVWLKERREQLGLTQAKLADCAGCSAITIRKIEADERRPSRQVAELLAGCLKIAPEDRPTFLKVARAELRGVYFVSLASLNAAEFMASAIAQAMNLALQGQASPAAQLLNYLRDTKRQALLVLDNFEHLLLTMLSGDAQGLNLLVDLLCQAPALNCWSPPANG